MSARLLMAGVAVVSVHVVALSLLWLGMRDPRAAAPGVDGASRPPATSPAPADRKDYRVVPRGSASGQTALRDTPEVRPDGLPAPVVQDPPPGTGPAVYVAKSGDSLWVIAKKYGTTVDRLLAANGLPSKYVLKIGDRLTIPN